MKYNNNNNNLKSINSFSQKSILFYFITPIISVSLITILIFQYKNIIKKLKKNNEEKIEDADKKITDAKNTYIKFQRLQLHNSRLYNYYKLLGLDKDDIDKLDKLDIFYINIECIFKLFEYRSFLIEYIIDMKIYHTSDLFHYYIEGENDWGVEENKESSSSNRIGISSSNHRIPLYDNPPIMNFFNYKIGGENKVNFLMNKEINYNRSETISNKIENINEFNDNIVFKEFFTFYFGMFAY